MKKTLYIVKKFIRGLSLLLGLSIISFVLVYNSPIDPIMAYVGYDSSLSVKQREALEKYWGLDKPASVQYRTWLKNLLRGDWGMSKVYKRSVLSIIKEKAIGSLALMGTSWLLSGIIGFSLGILAAVKRGRFTDKLIKWFSYLQASTPSFWFALLLLLFFSVQLKLLPIGISVPIGVMSSEVQFLDYIKHLILPIMTLSFLGIASVTLHTREKLVDVLDSEYVQFARARGESTGEIIKNHGIRNIALPAIVLHFASFGELFAGSVIAEKVFSYPALGSTLTDAGMKGDTPLLLGIVLVSGVFIFCGNMLGDFINALINPHLKASV